MASKSNTTLQKDINTGQYVSKPTRTSEKDGTVKDYIFNNEPYDVNITLDNGTQKIYINPQAIIYLTIDDSLSKWYISGEMVTEYHFDIIENNELNPEMMYSFRNDGFDFLKIKIKPTDPPETPRTPDDGDYEEFPQNQLEINLWLSIYNMEDIEVPGDSDTATALIRYKKFYFRDYRYQKMSTTIAEYSTALSPELLHLPSVVPDEERSLLTGSILLELISKLDIDPKLKITGADIDAENLWDTGGVKIFFTTGSQQLLSEALDYVMERHIASASSWYDSTAIAAVNETYQDPQGKVELHDVCILSVDRSTSKGGTDDYGFFTLIPLNKYFSKATERIYERFYIQSMTGEVGMDANYMFLSPPPSDTPIHELVVGGYSTIKRYRFVDISAYTNSNQILTRPVCTFNFKTRQFSIDVENNTVEIARKFIAEQYIKKIPTGGGGGGQEESKFLININKDKIDKKNIQVISSTSLGKIAQIDGLHHILYNSVFQNACINFDMPGQTFRVPGVLIAIEKPGGSNVNSTFDTRFCGVWFIIKVLHHFTNAQYYNNITAVKVHNYNSLSIDFKPY